MAPQPPPQQPVEPRGRAFLVTGAGGFLGRALCARLRALGAEVTPLTRADCDLRDRAQVAARLERLQATRWQAVLHLAADPDRTRDLGRLPALMETQLTGTLNLLEQLQAPLIHAGTLDEYGDGPAPFREDQAARPLSPYALSKCAAGALVTMVGGTHVRLGLVFGPGQGPGFFLPQLLRAARTGEELAMTAGEQVRDLLWLEDAVEGLVRLACAPPGGTVNLCTGVGTRLVDLVGLVEAALGRPVPVRVGALPYRAGEVFCAVGSPARLEQLTGWRPRISPAQGLTWMEEDPRGV